MNTVDNSTEKNCEEFEDANGGEIPLQVLLIEEDESPAVLLRNLNNGTDPMDVEGQFTSKGACFSSRSSNTNVRMDDTMVVECVVRTEEEEPVAECLSSDSKEGNEEIFESRTSLNEMDADQQRKLMEIAKECNDTMIRRLKSIASSRLNVDLSNEVVMELLAEQNRQKTIEKTNGSRVASKDIVESEVTVSKKDDEAFRGNRDPFLNLKEEQEMSLLKFAKQTDGVTVKQIREHLKDVAKVEATDLVIREFNDRNGIRLDADSKEEPTCLVDEEQAQMSDCSNDDAESSSEEKSSSRKRLTLSNMTRGTAIKLVCDRNMSHASVGKLLGIPKGTVSSMIRCFKSTSRIEKAQRGGCPPKLNEDQQLAIVNYVQENEGTTLKGIVQFIKVSYGINVTRSTIQRVLKSHNLVLRKTPVAFVKYLNNEFAEKPEADSAHDYRRLLPTTVETLSKERETASAAENRGRDESTAGENRKKRHLMLSNYIRHKIVEFVVRWGMSHSKVGNLLGIPKGTVSGVVRCFQQNNRINKIKQGGSYSKLTSEHKTALVKYVSENKDVSIRQAVEFVKQISGKQVSKQMIYSVLKPHDLHKRRKLPTWPEWYVSSKEHVADLPFKLQGNGNGRSTSVGTTSNDDVGGHSSSDTNAAVDGSSVPNLMDGDQEKVTFSYLDDHDNLLLQHMQGLFGSISEGPQTTKVVTAVGEDALGVMSTEPLSHVEVSSMAEDASYLDYTIKEEDGSGKTKKKYSCLSNVDRQRIISCVVHKGLSHAVVAKLFDVPRGTVSSIIRCFQKTSRIEKIHKGGSRPKLTKEQQQLMVRFHEENGPQSIKQLQNYCQNTFGIDVSKSTISLTLKKHMSPLKKKK